MTPSEEKDVRERVQRAADEPCKMAGGATFCEVREADLKAILAALQSAEQRATKLAEEVERLEASIQYDHLVRLKARAEAAEAATSALKALVAEKDAALEDIERIASARHGAELEEAVFAIRQLAGSARVGEEKWCDKCGDTISHCECHVLPAQETNALVAGSNAWWIVRRVANGDARRPWYELTREDISSLSALPAQDVGGLEELRQWIGETRATAERIKATIPDEYEAHVLGSPGNNAYRTGYQAGMESATKDVEAILARALANPQGERS